MKISLADYGALGVIDINPFLPILIHRRLFYFLVADPVRFPSNRRGRMVENDKKKKENALRFVDRGNIYLGLRSRCLPSRLHLHKLNDPCNHLAQPVLR